MAFTSIQKTLSKVLRRFNVRDIESIKLFGAWDRIVGEKLARHCQPVRIDRGILYVEVDDPIWLAQLKYMKIEIQAKITDFLEKETIREIRFFLKS